MMARPILAASTLSPTNDDDVIPHNLALMARGPEAPSPSRATMELDVALDTCHANMETCIAQLLSCLNKREREFE